MADFEQNCYKQIQGIDQTIGTGKIATSQKKDQLVVTFRMVQDGSRLNDQLGAGPGVGVSIHKS